MNNIEILEHIAIAYIDDEEFSQYVNPEGRLITNKQLAQALENLIQENKELKKENEKLTYARNWYFEHFTSQACTPEQLHKILRFDYIPKSKVKEKIEEINKRIDYLDKELAEAYIQREKLGTETELDSNEQYIYNMEQERSVRHTEKYAYLKLL